MARVSGERVLFGPYGGAEEEGLGEYGGRARDSLHHLLGLGHVAGLECRRVFPGPERIGGRVHRDRVVDSGEPVCRELGGGLLSLGELGDGRDRSHVD